MPNDTTADFLADLNPKEGDALDQPAPEVTPEEQPTAEDVDDSEARNRRERRLQAKLQAERESAIALAARLEALTEAQKARSSSSEAEYLKAVERIYGTSSPEAVEATELLKTALSNVEKQATERALEVFREEQRKEREAVQREEQSLDAMVEDIEDSYGVTLDPNAQRAFFQHLEKLSPKDRQGNIIAYADHHAVWEELQARRKPADTRAKDLAARATVRSGGAAPSSAEDDATLRFLRDNGII